MTVERLVTNLCCWTGARIASPPHPSNQRDVARVHFFEMTSALRTSKPGAVVLPPIWVP